MVSYSNIHHNVYRPTNVPRINTGADLCNDLMNNLPCFVLSELSESLNVPGQCGWKNLQKIVQRNLAFSDEDAEKLSDCSESNSKLLLSILCQKGVSVGYLLESLRSLPCHCSLNLLNKNLALLMPSTNEAIHAGHVSWPGHNGHGPNGTNPSYPLSLPTNFELSNTASQCNIITEHPKEQSIKDGDDIILKVGVKASRGVTFQWFCMFEKVSSPTANKHMLLLPDAKISNEGFYCCRVSVDGKSELSSWAYVSVGPSESKCFATDKVALLIANEQYANHAQLPAASRDVEAITNILQNELNFKTFSFVNLNFTEIHRALDWLCMKAKKGCYCVFYFGGHGYENDGKCYMVPVDAPKVYNNSNCVNAHTELENIQRRCAPSLMLILLDICRKRNMKEPASTHNTTALLSNVVLAYATTESREAYERRGERHGVFVDSLRKHLAKPKRVTYMLTDVQDDVKRSCLQIAEVRTTLGEERCLTDPIKPLQARANSRANALVEEHTKWLDLHNKINNDPVILEVGQRSTIARMELRHRSILTNKIELLIRVIDLDQSKYDYGFVNLVKGSFQADLQIEIIEQNPLLVHISNLQKARNSQLSFSIYFCCWTREGKPRGGIYHQTLRPSFFRHWHCRHGYD